MNPQSSEAQRSAAVEPLASPKVVPTMERRGVLLAQPAEQIDRLRSIDVHGPFGGDFDRALASVQLSPLQARGVSVLQVNLGRVCNQTCAHCHVDAGPDRKEDMPLDVAGDVIELLERSDIPTLDITGGAPEMGKSFRYLVGEAHRLGRHVIDRCNLTILLAQRYQDLPEFLAQHQVEIVCSLPHYRKFSTDRQRGQGVFDSSIEGLRRLNALGYGQPGSGLRLVLVTNPVGAFLPGGQASLEAEWKREMKRLHDIDFDALFTITNMPISRYLEWLEDSGKLEGYMQALVDAFNPAAAEGVMCRTTLSVDWRGRLFDCDFNQMLDLGLAEGTPQTLAELKATDLDGVLHRRIVTDRHCFGCTAGAGSSCGGSLDS